jgi:hypothetical protein
MHHCLERKGLCVWIAMNLTLFFCNLCGKGDIVCHHTCQLLPCAYPLGVDMGYPIVVQCEHIWTKWADASFILALFVYTQGLKY